MNTKRHSQYKQQRAVTWLQFVLDNDLIFPFSLQEHGICKRGLFLFILSLGGQKGRQLGEKTVWSYSSLPATSVLTTPRDFRNMIRQLRSPVALLLFAQLRIIILLSCMTAHPGQSWFSHWVQNHNANRAKGPLPTPACNPHTTYISITSVSCGRPKEESWAGSTRCCPQKGKIPIQLFLTFTITLLVFRSTVLNTCFTICHVRLIKRVQKQCLLLTFGHIIQH